MDSALAASVWQLLNPPPAPAADPGLPQPRLPPSAETSPGVQAFEMPLAGAPTPSTAGPPGAAPALAAPAAPAVTEPLPSPLGSDASGAADDDAGLQFLNVYNDGSHAKPWRTYFRCKINGKSASSAFGSYADQVDAAIARDAGQLWAGLQNGAERQQGELSGV